MVSASLLHIEVACTDPFYGVQGKFLKIFGANRGRPDQEGPQISQIGKPGRRFASVAATDLERPVNLCKSGTRERSRWEANDTDGKAERPSERERASQSVDERSVSVSSDLCDEDGF